MITMNSKRVEAPQSRFCIGFHQDGNLSVQTCTRIMDDKNDSGSAYEEEYEDYYPSGDGEEFDHCQLYETEDDEQCSHANFPERDAIPRGAMRCCDGHRYK